MIRKCPYCEKPSLIVEYPEFLKEMKLLRTDFFNHTGNVVKELDIIKRRLAIMEKTIKEIYRRVSL